MEENILIIIMKTSCSVNCYFLGRELDMGEPSNLSGVYRMLPEHRYPTGSQHLADSDGTAVHVYFTPIRQHSEAMELEMSGKNGKLFFSLPHTVHAIQNFNKNYHTFIIFFISRFSCKIIQVIFYSIPKINYFAAF